MTKEVKMYRCVCDWCGADAGYLSDNSEGARRLALSHGWYEFDKKIYCFRCVEYDHSTHTILPKYRVSARTFLNRICADNLFDVRSVLSTDRRADIVEQRRICQYILYIKGYSFVEIAKATNRHHSSVIYNVNTVHSWQRLPKVFRRQLSILNPIIEKY